MGWDELDIVAKGEGWKLLRRAPDGGRNVAYAQMGPVLYPINASAIEGLDHNELEFLRHSVILDFKIGELDIAASRETLSYGRSAPTNDSIVTRVKAPINEMAEVVLATYPACDTYWNACIKMVLDCGGNIPAAVTVRIRKEAQWGGVKLSSVITAEKTPGTVSTSVLDAKKLRNKMLRFRAHDWNEKLSVSPSDNVLFVIEDTSIDKPVKRMSDRIRLYRSEKMGANTVVWIKYHGGRVASEWMDRYLNIIDGAEIVMAHDMELPERISYARGEYTPVQARYFDGCDFTRKITLTAEEHEEGGYYVKMERGVELTHYSVSSLVSALKNMGEIGDAYIIGVPKTLWKRFSGEQWTELCEFAEDVYDAAAIGVEEAVALHRDAISTRNNSLLNYLFRKIDLDAVSSKSNINEATEFLQRVRDMDTDNPRALLGLGSALNRHIDTVSSDIRKELDFYVELIEDAYPLISALSDNYSFNNRENSVDLLTEYVIMCDTAEKPNQAALAA